MNRLWVRLTLAFGLVTFVAVTIAAFLANQQVSTSFKRYVTHNQMMESTTIPLLVEYYAANGTWDGVETVMENLPGQGMGMGQGQGKGTNRGLRRGAPTTLLANADKRIVYDESGERLLEKLSTSDINNAIPINWNNEPIGYLVSTASPEQTGLTEAGQTFLDQLNRSLIQAGLIAGVLGMLLGLVIARSVSAPLGKLSAAARRISYGELNQRVPEKGSDEITDLAHAFNEMASNLEQAETMRRNLVADVAHELRTPLSVVQGNLRAILDDVYPLDKEEIASIYDETLILNRLITDLRELAHAEAGQLKLNIEPTPLAPIITAMAARFKELTREKDISLSVHLAENLPSSVLADSDRIRQILHNFLANALRHTPTGGSIKIVAEQKTEKRKSPPISGDKQPVVTGQYIQITVTDTGTGISPEALPHVFDRFWRAEKSRSRDQGGSGLGLAITNQLVKAHGGQTGVKSQLGQGSSFWFTLPVA